MTSRIKCKECDAESMADGAQLACWFCYDTLEETLKLERRRFHRAAARWVDEMSSLEEENVRLRQEIARLQKIEEAAKEYQLTKNITWRLELFRLVKEGG